MSSVPTPFVDFHPEVSPRVNPARNSALSAGHLDEVTAYLCSPSMPNDSDEFLREMSIQDAIELATDALRGDMEEARRMVSGIKPNGCITSMHRTQSWSDNFRFQTSCIVAVMVQSTLGILAQGSGATMIEAARACLRDFNRSCAIAVAVAA